MSERSRMDRRSVLLGALVAAVPLGLAPFRPWRVLIETLPRESLASRLTGLLSNLESARVVGREYVRVASPEATSQRLVDAVAAGVPGGRDVIRAASNGDLRRLILARVRQDFDDDDVVTLDGWIVSRTEGRLCALALTSNTATPQHATTRE
ncbi:hypothetical protein BH20ACT13_BH20ACT13_10770 [soil metagenome]